MNESVETPPTSIAWTQQHRYLWTGRSAGKPVGTIERGARYTYIDAIGAEYHGFGSLSEAQHAAESLLPAPQTN